MSMAKIFSFLNDVRIYRFMYNSVADPDPVYLGHSDPDPLKNWIGILYQQKYPCNSNFLVT